MEHSRDKAKREAREKRYREQREARERMKTGRLLYDSTSAGPALKLPKGGYFPLFRAAELLRKAQK